MTMSTAITLIQDHIDKLTERLGTHISAQQLYKNQALHEQRQAESLDPVIQELKRVLDRLNFDELKRETRIT